jgi:hypothetical protein
MPPRTPDQGGAKSSGRRSQRVLLNMPIIVRTEAGPRGPGFTEETQTLVVNAHGALIAVAGRLEQGQTFYVSNRVTHEEEQCRVIYVGPVTAGKAQVGIEFAKPSPDFWRITFPPEDWVTPESAPTTSKAPSSGQPKPAPPAKKL